MAERTLRFAHVYASTMTPRATSNAARAALVTGEMDARSAACCSGVMHWLHMTPTITSVAPMETINLKNDVIAEAWWQPDESLPASSVPLPPPLPFVSGITAFTLLHVSPWTSRQWLELVRYLLSASRGQAMSREKSSMGTHNFSDARMYPNSHSTSANVHWHRSLEVTCCLKPTGLAQKSSPVAARRLIERLRPNRHAPPKSKSS
mmetsp:Transcript_644/g.1704  ORF Transcript_644/g.1704 Transcript_644/m.1704 type:complete len:206 (+) Transcript_644:1240-1857(+)